MPHFQAQMWVDNDQDIVVMYHKNFRFIMFIMHCLFQEHMSVCIEPMECDGEIAEASSQSAVVDALPVEDPSQTNTVDFPSSTHFTLYRVSCIEASTPNLTYTAPSVHGSRELQHARVQRSCVPSQEAVSNG